MLLNKLKARLSSFEEAFSTASEKMADILQVQRPETREEKRREEARHPRCKRAVDGGALQGVIRVPSVGRKHNTLYLC